MGFRNIDFGPYGSDTITIPIFALSSEEYFIQIWEGMPDEEGSTLLADVVYDKESRWNVYQEETYHLSKRLSGITSICFVLKQKIHIKGFSFERQSRAFEQNTAASCDHLYGIHSRSRVIMLRGSGTMCRWSLKIWTSRQTARPSL